MDDNQATDRPRYMNEWDTSRDRKCETCGEPMSQFLPGEFDRHLESADRFINEGFSAFAKTDVQPDASFTSFDAAIEKVTPTFLVELCEPCFHEENSRLSSMAIAARSQVEVVRGNITRSTTDAIVNAANERLAEGGGVCGAIFNAVGRVGGHARLTAACDAIGHCPTGDAVITPSFGLDAPWIIHAVGPVWRGERDVMPKELSAENTTQLHQLASAYRAVLRVCRENGISSVTIPAISTGIFGLPKELGAAIARTVCARDAGAVTVTLIAYEDDSYATLSGAPTALALRMLTNAGVL